MQGRPVVPALVRAVVRPMQVFFQLEAASGIVLLASAVAALVWANSAAGGSYQAIVASKLSLGGSRSIPLLAVINDGLMAIFFFLVGMEIKRELAAGELRTVPKALLPAIAALGGMLVPGALYTALNWGTPAARGWAIPMATDIAFSIGVLTLLKGRVHDALIVFLTALAIFDDLGGIVVIALFYGTGLKLAWLAFAAAVAGAAFITGRAGVRSFLPYGLLGVLLWFGLHEAGVHATIAGVVLGLAVPATSTSTQQAPLARYIDGLHPWVAFGIMPLFALANSGVVLRGAGWADLLDPVCLGAGLGLFAGKQLGIFAFTMAAVKLGFAGMPGNARKLQLYGVAIVGGIGFTVAIFIASLSFPGDPARLAASKLGILLGSLVSGVAGYALLRLTPPAPQGVAEGAPEAA